MSGGLRVETPRVVVATGNRGKLREIDALLGGLGLAFLAQSELGVTQAEETAVTFVENALIKARNAALQTGLPAIADDSGLQVDALEGAPGVRSARYAGPAASDADNNARLLENLAGVPAPLRSARFVCLMVYVAGPADPRPVIAEGLWEGRILQAPRGEAGFGYDPLFLVPGQDRSAAELEPELKNRLSHRGQALRALLAALGPRLAARSAPGRPA